MKYNGKEVSLFGDDFIKELKMSNDEITDDVCQKYFVILQELRSKKLFVSGKVISERFKAQYSIELDEEEATELRTFCEDDYNDWKMAKMQEDMMNGMTVAKIPGLTD